MDKPKVQLASLLRFVVSHEGQEKVRTVQKQEAVLGRSSAEQPVDLDLSQDTNVSRRHARIWQQGGAYWIEDLGSKGGTLLNGIEIKGAGKRALPPVGAVVEVGNTKIRVEIPADPIHSFLLLPPTRTLEATVDLELAADLPAEKLVAPDSIAALQNLVRVLELPLQFLTVQNLHDLLTIILERTLEIIPADAGAILLNSRNNDALHLGAFAGEPQLSEPLARRAMSQGNGITWHVTPTPGFGMYVSMQWNGKKVGVICLNRKENGFGPVDLPTLIVLSRFAACALDRGLTK